MRRAVVWVAALIALALVWLSFSRLSPPVEEPRGETRTGTEHDVNEPEYPEGLVEEALPRLVAFLKEDRSSSKTLPSRDIFQKGARPAAAPVTPAPTEDNPVEPEQPRLTGFLLSGGNLGRPVASIRFEGRMWLVGVGEHVGPFRVDEMVAGEDVTLVHQETGELLRLSIQ